MSRPLKAGDLVPGRIYYSPTGRLCRLLETSEGISRMAYSFMYLSQGRYVQDDGFNLLATNDRAIAALREAPGYLTMVRECAK
jgi:hypothetical protein